MSTTNFEPDQPVRITQGLVGTSAAGATVKVSDATDPDGDVDANWLEFSGASVSEGEDGQALIDLTPGIRTLTNGSGSDVTAYMVVVNDQTADDTFITTTTPQFTDGAVGVAQANIAAGESGPILFNGYTPVQVAAAVTRGDFLETSSTAGMATTNTTRREGSFGVLLTGADPTAVTLDGLSDMIIDTLTTVRTTNGTSLTVNVPATKPDGMLMVLSLWFSGAVTGLTATGWTLIGTPAGNQAYYWRVSSSEPATYSVSWTNSVQCVAGIAILDALDTASPIAGSNYENTTAAAAITGLTSDYYLAIAGVKGLTATPTGWTALLADTSSTGGAGSPAAIVQSYNNRTNSSTQLRTNLASAVTPGNLLVVALSHRQGGTNPITQALAHAGLTGSGTSRPFTNFGPTVAVDTSDIYGSSCLAMGYRIATGDEQDLTWGTTSTLMDATIWEVSNAAVPSTFEVLSKTNQTGATKNIGTFVTPGDLQLAAFHWYNASTTQSPGAGYTQDYQANHDWPANGAPGFLTEHGSTGTDPEITGSSFNWAGVAVGITSGTVAVSGELVAELFNGTGVTSPFSGASLATDAVVAFSLVPVPFTTEPVATAVIWNGTDLNQAGGSSTISDGTTTIAPFSELDVPPGGLTDEGGGHVRLNFLTDTYGEQHRLVTTAAAGATHTIDCSAGNVFDITLTAACVLSISNPPPSGVASTIQVILRQGGTGSYTVTWPGAVDWPDTDGTTGGSAPTLWTAVGAQDDIELSTVDGGTTWGGTFLAHPVSAYTLTVKDEGTPLATGATSIDFVGAGVVASGATAAKTVTIPDNTVTGVTVTDAGTTGDVLTKTGASTATWSTPASSSSTGVAFIVIGQEERISDGSTVAWTLDNDFEENSVSARNLTTGHVLSVSETLPNTATISAAGTAGDIIAFAYAATVI